MKKLFLLLCIFAVSVSVLADTTAPTKPTKPTNEKDIAIMLVQQTSQNKFRAPSLNPNGQLEGLYEASGVLSIYLFEDSMWELKITSAQGIETYLVSTSDLSLGVNIGQLTEFTITLTNEAGVTYVGDVYVE